VAPFGGVRSLRSFVGLEAFLCPDSCSPKKNLAFKLFRTSYWHPLVLDRLIDFRLLGGASMGRALRVAGYVAGATAVLMAVGYGAVFAVSSRKLAEKYEVMMPDVVLPHDDGSIAWGGHLVDAVTGCQDCHGQDLSGRVMSDDPVALLAAPNLTAGLGGLGGELSDEDWIRAIRYGVRRDGRSLLVMPSYAYAHLSDRDLGAMVAYLKQLPPVDNELPALKLRPLGRALLAAGPLDGELVARKASLLAPSDGIEPGMSLEYGQYLATISGCTSCHGPDLKGGPSGPPDAPPASDISPSALAGWDGRDFFRAMREGRRPDGALLSDYMPWRVMGAMTDDELNAIWLFLRSVSPD
jgi:mono/diheme cytochrome c family protein